MVQNWYKNQILKDKIRKEKKRIKIQSKTYSNQKIKNQI